jgi:DNA-binding CsgD family transcriptional regulator/tetratricopeptide (TPR) repeat protein
VCAPALDLRDRLPTPQREALESAFGLSAKPLPGRLVVALAVLSLLSEVAAAEPLLCVIDDAQWLDSSSAVTLAFVARRLPAAPLGFVVAADTRCELREFAGLPELVVGGLSELEARALFDSLLPGRLDETVRDRVVSEARGNPRTLHELAKVMARREAAGGFAVSDLVRQVNGLDPPATEQLESLPVDARRLLLAAAAEPLGDACLLRRATALLGLGPDAAIPAKAAGLIDIAIQVRFSHPLLRAVIYREASLAERQEVHCALADATDRDRDPDRRAWHRAHATDSRDEEVAADLEFCVPTAAARGGAAAAAAFLARATVLTPDPARRGQRALAAAEQELHAGEFEEAESLLVTAEAEPLNDLLRARIDLTRGRIAFARGNALEACPLLLDTGRRFESLDAGLAGDAYLEALSAAVVGGPRASGSDACEVAQAARAATPAPRGDDGNVLLEAVTVRLTEGYAVAAPLASRALNADDDGHTPLRSLRRVWLRSLVAADLWDDERWDADSARYVKLARRGGVLSELPLALDSRVLVQLFAGELAEAARLVDEAHAVSDMSGSGLPLRGALALAAWWGRDGEAGRVIEAASSDAAVSGDGIGRTITRWAAALLSNSLGRYEDALAPAQEAATSLWDLSTPNWALVELIEAGARCGRTELVTEALERLCEMTRASGTDWALGVGARSRALLSVGAAADRLYRQAIERLGRTRVRAELARTHLLYGEWLRRENRRVDARIQLRDAHDLFVTIGMEAFAERSRRELVATGERVRKQAVETRDDLTAQERQIAQLARDGLSNPEIGARLFLSPRTVEWHLRKVFSKLDIHSRGQLFRVLPESNSAVQVQPAVTTTSLTSAM